MRDQGPEAPTLCAGWTVGDLAVHLLARESRLDYLPGLALRQFAGRTACIAADLRRSNAWPAVLSRLGAGPSSRSPFKWFDAVANVHEFFVHHEDIRRAGTEWRPRDLTTGQQRMLCRLTVVLSRIVLPTLKARVSLRTPDGRVVTALGRGRPVTVIGEGGELLLFVFGREQIKAEFVGDDDVIRAIKAAKRRV